MVDDQYATKRLSSWDNKVYSQSYNPSQSIQNISSIPISPTSNYVVPLSKYNSHNPPQYVIDGRQAQQAKYQSQPVETFQPNQKNPSKTNNSGWCAKHVTINKVNGLLLGLVITGIPLAVIVTLYVELSTSSSSAANNGSSSSSSSSSNSTSYSLPYQCSSGNYNLLTDSYRPVTYTAMCSGSCDNGINGWYRVSGAAGTQLVTYPIAAGSCGTDYPVWFNGSLPTTPGITTSGYACVNYNGNLCYLGYSPYMVLATNCNGFYVFYLTPLTYCASCFYYTRYCTV